MDSTRPDLTFKEFGELLAGAFLPFSCTLESLDNGAGFSFRIVDGDVGVLKVTYSNAGRISDRRARSVISQTRTRLREHGRTLTPWRFPERGSA